MYKIKNRKIRQYKTNEFKRLKPLPRICIPTSIPHLNAWPFGANDTISAGYCEWLSRGSAMVIPSGWFKSIVNSTSSFFNCILVGLSFAKIIVQIDLYWKSCDLNVDHKLNFKEWLPCSGIYSDNGHLFEQTEWDNMINDGYLRFDSFNKLELTDKALQEYSQRQPKIQRGADSGEIELWRWATYSIKPFNKIYELLKMGRLSI